MNLIQREHDRINEALRQTQQSDAQYPILLAAQQALAWAIDPITFGRPLNVIQQYLSTETD
jgi:hypothetical protein